MLYSVYYKNKRNKMNRYSFQVDIILFLSFWLACASVEGKEYEPKWDDLDTRPLPQWYDQAKVGVCVYWGIYSVPSFVSEKFWEMWKVSAIAQKSNKEKVREFMKQHFAPDFTYQDFAAKFKAEFFNASEWAQLFKASGAKYIVFTSKDYEGFNMWPAKSSFSWNSQDTGPRRDIVGELSKAVRNAELKFGVQYSLIEWFNPLYINDRQNKYGTQEYPSAKVWPDLKSLVEEYKPSLLWTFGGRGAGSGDNYWNSTGILSWVYNSSPNKDEIVTNDGWGGPYCKHGDVRYWCNQIDVLQKRKWEEPLKIDTTPGSWIYRRNGHLKDFKNIKDILNILVRVVSCGGNVLINVGATKEGMISPIYEERLLQLGEWLGINGEAIYDTNPWIRQNDSFNGDVWYTCNRKQAYNGLDPLVPPAKGSDVHAIYLIALRWPHKRQLIVKDIAPFMKQDSNVTMLGGKKLEWQYAENHRIQIKFPNLKPYKLLAKQEAWALKIVFGQGACEMKDGLLRC